MQDTTVGPPADGAAGDGPPAADLAVAGLVFRVEASQRSDLELVQRVLGSRAARGEADVTVEIGARPPTPDRPPDFRGPYGDHWDDGATHWFDHAWGLSTTATAQRIRLGGPSTGFERWVAVRNSMLFALARVFLARDGFVLHAAAVRRAGRALVLIGDSGTGKSTLAYAAWRDGWELLGDDMIVVDRDPDDGDLRVRGIPRVPSVPGDLRDVGDLGGDRLPHDERQRIEVPTVELDTRPCPIGAVIVCGHAVGTSSLESVPGPEVVRSVVPAFVLSALEDPLRRWFPLAVELAGRPGLRLGHDVDPDRRLDEAARRLDEAALRMERPAGAGRQPPNAPDATSSR